MYIVLKCLRTEVVGDLEGTMLTQRHFSC